MSEIHIGFSEGKPVKIPLAHTIVAAITRYGKSTTLKHMKESLPEDFPILFLDVKKPRDFQGMGLEVPIYLEDRIDPVGLKNLLEASGKMGLKFEFSELIKVCKQCAAEDKEGRYGFRDVLNGITKSLKEKMHPIRESKLLVLQHLLGRLIRDLDKTEIADKLELPSRFNVMNLSNAPRMVKQLAVYSTIKWVLEQGKKTVIVLDEVPDFAPQRHGTPAREVIGEAVRKGGGSDIWLWLSGQTITGVDKNVLKQCNYWILGRQREWNEAKRTLDQIPFKTGLKVEDIMNLPVGHFIVVSEEGAYLTYVQPPGVDADVARKVSLGELSVKDVKKFMVMEDEDLTYKPLWEEEKRKREELEKEFARQLERLSDLKAEEKTREFEKRVEEERQKAFREALQKVEEIKKQWKVEEYQQVIAQLKDEKVTLETALKQLEPLKAFKEAFMKAFGVPGGPAGTKTVLDLEHRELVARISHSEEVVNMNTGTVNGKVIFCALEDLPKEGFSEGELSKALKEHGWNIGHSTLAPTLGGLVKEGYLIKIEGTRPTKYRLPTKTRFNVT